MDRELVEQAQGGDEAAFAQLVVQAGDRLHAVARHILRDSDLAADATQQAFVEIWRQLPQLRDPTRFEGWAYRIVVRAAYAEHRRRSAWRLRTVVPGVGVADAADASVDDRDQLERGFARLSLEHRAVVVLKHFAGLTDHEIADALDISEGTVRSRLFYAMQGLRAALEADRRVPEGAIS